MIFLTFHILEISWSQLTFIFFRGGRYTTNQIIWVKSTNIYKPIFSTLSSYENPSIVIVIWKTIVRSNKSLYSTSPIISFARANWLRTSAWSGVWAPTEDFGLMASLTYEHLGRESSDGIHGECLDTGMCLVGGFKHWFSMGYNDG